MGIFYSKDIDLVRQSNGELDNKTVKSTRGPGRQLHCRRFPQCYTLQSRIFRFNLLRLLPRSSHHDHCRKKYHKEICIDLLYQAVDLHAPFAPAAHRHADPGQEH